MISEISYSVQLLMEYLMISLITHYVFLIKKQRRFGKFHFDAVAIVLLEIINWKISPHVAELLLFLLGGLRISMVYNKNKIRKFLLIFPICGIIDGLFLPIIVMPSKVIGLSRNAQMVYQTIIYLGILLVFSVFFFSGKNWRLQFEKELEGRKLQKWEEILLCTVGVLLLFLSSILDEPIKEFAKGEFGEVRIYSVLALLSLTSFLMTLTVIIVVLVGNKQNYYHDQVTDMQFNIIVMMAEIVENRDKNTGGHIKRTAGYVEIIAKQLKKQGSYKEQLTEQYIKDMIVAAPLHDIGKIHVSDVILNKKGKLTEEEFSIMKGHAADGRNLLRQAKQHLGEFSYLDMAENMAGFHHEWWDGSQKGYPERRKGEEIPLCARIMAVADVFDALISKRCYKDAMPLEKAYSIIREESGSHFDPVVVDAFFAATGKIETALEHFRVEEIYG